MTANHRGLIALAAAALIAAGGCGGPAQAPNLENAVKFGSTKAGLLGLPPEYAALHTCLEKLFERPVLFDAQPHGDALALQLAQGRLWYALMTAAEYASISDPSKLSFVASAVNPQGRTSRKAFIVVRANSHVKTIRDCAGKRFAFGTLNDPLTDFAARRALEEAGVPVKKLLPELLLPPPLTWEGRLYVSPAKSWFDLTVNAGVIDELDYNRLPESGGNPITGPSKDQFKIVGETMAVPELVVVAGPAADPQITAKLKTYLLNTVKDEKKVCEQLGICGFAEPDPAAYEAVRRMIQATRSKA